MTSTNRSNRLAIAGTVRVPATQDDEGGFRALDREWLPGSTKSESGSAPAKFPTVGNFLSRNRDFCLFRGP